jgi:hypothetical protein
MPKRMLVPGCYPGAENLSLSMQDAKPMQNAKMQNAFVHPCIVALVRLVIPSSSA